MTSRRSRSTRRTAEEGAVATSDASSDAEHPIDPRIYADGRPKLTKGNPHAPGTAAFLAWEDGYRPGFAADASEGAESETEL
jgi:hypothetical protein